MINKVKIESIDHQGRGIAHKDGYTIFIQGALPGEVVDIQILKEKKNIKEASTIRIHEKSDKRTKPKCPYFGMCGGCDIMHISYEDTLRYKENKVKEIFHKFYQDVFIKPILHGEEYFYRNKVTFKVKENKMGYYSKKSYDLILIDGCLLLDEKMNKVIKILKTLDLKNIDEIIIRTSKFLDETLVAFHMRDSIIEEEIVHNLKSVVDTITVYGSKEKVLYGKGYIEEKIKQWHFKISPLSFFQVNSNGMILLYDKVLEYLNPTGKERVLDYYCGTGTIGIYVSPYVREVVGVEINGSSYQDALDNKEKNHISNIKFYHQNANTFTGTHFDSVIVDPPRGGLDVKTKNHLKKINAEKIIYVSCDPVTLARDLKDLSDLYEVMEVTPVDMFPYTYHVECVALLSLKNTSETLEK